MNIHIRPYSPEHCQAVLNLSLRAWQPVFAQMQPAVPSFVYTNFYPNGWEARQLSDLQAVLDGEPEHVWLACAGSEIAGWTAIRLHPEDRMGEIYILATAPEYQRQGVATLLMEHAFEQIRTAGMDMVMVETGGDPGHLAARQCYESAGFRPWPVARYFKPL